MRIESGSVVFGSDWPGLFIRGDSALYYAQLLKPVLDAAVTSEDPEVECCARMLQINLLPKLESVDVEAAVERQRLRPASECLADRPTLRGPGPEDSGDAKLELE